MVGTRYKTAGVPSEQRPASTRLSLETLQIEPGVRIVIDQPAGDESKPVLLAFYALPNGNTIEQTIGKALRPGDDWHFGIQHIGAQTRYLRERITDRRLVVAYLENDLKAWPAWRRKHGDTGIPGIFEAVMKRFPSAQRRIVLAGHSGGGSLIFGYLNCLEAIPDDVERISFLDANYAYETERHRDKLANWLTRPEPHFLMVLAYNDGVALLNGKTFVSAEGGTWGRSHQMLRDLEPSIPITRTTLGEIDCRKALNGRVAFLLKENPEKKIFHTVQVERNGFIESLLSGTNAEGADYVYFGERAYTEYIRDE